MPVVHVLHEALSRFALGFPKVATKFPLGFFQETNHEIIVDIKDIYIILYIIYIYTFLYIQFLYIFTYSWLIFMITDGKNNEIISGICCYLLVFLAYTV